MLILRPLIRYADFSGRARRAEYWLFVLFHGLVVGGSLGSAFGALGDPDASAAFAGFMTWSSIAGLAALGLALPYYAVLARRLHDIGQTAWWMLLLLPGLAAPFLIGQSLAGAVIGGEGGQAAAADAVMQAFAQGMLWLALAGVCNLALLVMTLLPGVRGPNRFGPDPRDPDARIGGARFGLYDDDRLEELFAEAKREREDEYRPVFDFGPDADAAPAVMRATMSAPAEPDPASAARAVDWGRPAWDPGVAPSRPFGRRGA